MTGNEVAGPFTEYEAALEKRNAEGREAEKAEAFEAEVLDEALDVLEAIQRSYHRTSYEDTGSAPPLPDGPGEFVRTSTGYRRLDKVPLEDHEGGRRLRRFVAQDETGGQVLVELYEKREDHPVGYGAWAIDRMTLAFRAHPLHAWGPPSEAREA